MDMRGIWGGGRAKPERYVDGMPVVAEFIARAPATGEVFVMRAPDLRAGGLLGDIMRHADVQQSKYWQVLKEVIEHSGAEVRLVKEGGRDVEAHHGRAPMFVRDTAIVQDGIVLTNAEPGRTPRSDDERSALLGLLKEDAAYAEHQHEIKGKIEGGNVVRHPRGNMLFVGVNHDAARSVTDAQMRHGWLPSSAGKEVLRMLTHSNAKEYGRANAELSAALGQKVIPLYFPLDPHKDFYHLDGVFGVLPSGEAVVCKEKLSRTANLAIEKYIGKDKIIPISATEALNGATNFITVGKRIITPYTNARLTSAFSALGYDTITPQRVGLPDDAWNFAPMGMVRCATLKLTDDKAFPGCEAQKMPQGRGV